MIIEAISKEDPDPYKKLMLPYIYREFKGLRGAGETDTEYFGLAAVLEEGDEGYKKIRVRNGGSRVASVIVIQPEATGDLNIVSIYTRPECRRNGYASALADKALFVARQLFTWEEGETEDVIIYKTVYRLPADLGGMYEAFLKKNGFTDFVLLESAEENAMLKAMAGEEGIEALSKEALDTWSASAYVKFFRDGAEAPGSDEDPLEDHL